MHNRFKQIVLTGRIELLEETASRIADLSEGEFKFFNTAAESEDEVAQRIGSADAVLLGWGNHLNATVMAQCRNLGYVGMCGTSTHLIDTEHASHNGIHVTNVSNYSSDATAEFIFGQLLMLFRGQREPRYRVRPRELAGKTLGLVGVGDIGQRMIPIAHGFGMDVVYTATSSKPKLEEANCRFVTLRDLLKEAGIISLHVPVGSMVMTQDVFSQLDDGKVLVNTCLGNVMDADACAAWVKRAGNFVVMDRATHDPYKNSLGNLERVIIVPEVAGQTYESRVRLGNQLVANLKAFLKST